MTRDKKTNEDALAAPLMEHEAMALDADLALLMRSDPVPEVSDDLMASILADAAEAVPAPLLAPTTVRETERPGVMSSLIALWRPMSAGLAAAALGVWIGWADPAGVSDFADGFILADLSDVDAAGFGSADFGNSVLEPADLLDLEL